MLKYIVGEVLWPMGYEVIRGDQLPDPGAITSTVIEHIKSADLVVADLTGANANVYYELAIRHVTGKPFIQLLSIDEELPFDIGNLRTIRFDIHDLDSVTATKEELQHAVVHLEEHPEVETPVSVALHLEAAAAVDEPLAPVLKEITRTLNWLTNEVRGLRAESPVGGTSYASTSSYGSYGSYGATRGSYGSYGSSGPPGYGPAVSTSSQEPAAPETSDAAASGFREDRRDNDVKA